MCVWATGLLVHLVIDWETEHVLHVTVHKEIADRIARKMNEPYAPFEKVTVVERRLMPEDPHEPGDSGVVSGPSDTGSDGGGQYQADAV